LDYDSVLILHQCIYKSSKCTQLKWYMNYYLENICILNNVDDDW